MLLDALMVLHFVTWGGPACAPIPDRDGDGRPELVMSTGSWGMKKQALLVFLSRSRKEGQVVEAPVGSLDFGDCLARLDPRLTEDCLLVSDVVHSSGRDRYEGIVYRYDKDLKEIGRIEPESDEEWFGVHLALGAFRSNDQLLAVQLEKTEIPEKTYWVSEWFAVYSLSDHRRRGLIRGSRCADPNLSDRRGASVVCVWIPDCDGDGFEDLAIDMRDSVVLYSSKDLQPVRTIGYAQYLGEYQVDSRSLTFVREAQGAASLVLGLPGGTISFPKDSFMLAWDLGGKRGVRRIENPSDAAGFGFAMCQIDSGDCFVTGVTGFDSCVTFAKPDHLGDFKVAFTGEWEANVGSAISRIGDFDGDGVEDVAVTRYDVERAADECQGVILFSGRTHDIIGRIELHGDRYVFR